MKLPNPEQAVIPDQKLSGYCLNPNHLDGKHKAYVFQVVLGIGLAEEEELRQILRDAIQKYESTPDENIQYGQKYVVDFQLTRNEQQAIVRSVWIVRNEENFPRLVSCYVR